jgi:hypothetical protein
MPQVVQALTQLLTQLRPLAVAVALEIQMDFQAVLDQVQAAVVVVHFLVDQRRKAIQVGQLVMVKQVAVTQQVQPLAAVVALL